MRPQKIAPAIRLEQSPHTVRWQNPQRGNEN